MINWIKGHKYCLWLLYFVFYFPAFFMLEHLRDVKFIITCPADNAIPFCELFIFPYFAWYIIMPLSLLFFMYKNREDFLHLCFLMFTGMTMALLVYFIVPNAVDLRPDIISDNIAGKICSFLYSVDVSSNACPSIHVASAAAIDIAVQKSETFKKNIPIRIISFVIMILISLSTMFVKQHSIIDAAAGAALSVMLYIIAYHTPLFVFVKIIRMSKIPKNRV